MTRPVADLARPYARALYEAAVSRGAEERVAQDLALLRDLWDGESELAVPFLTHPLIHARVKEAVLERALAPTLHPLTLNLVRLLVRRGKAILIPDLVPAFFREEEERGRSLHVLAHTARPLSSEERAVLQSRLGEALRRTVLIEERVDPHLLAGIELSVSGRRVEASLQARLTELMAQLKG